ncbi:MAG: hypothetical protein ACLFNQ_12780 [Spirochaetaceae bacterium]
MRTTLFVALLAVTSAFALLAQTAERIEQIGNEDQVSVGSAAFVVAASAGLVSDDATAAQALDVLENLGFPAGVEPSVPARLDQFAYMLMLAFDRSGGIMYSLLPGPRYALRELDYERVLRGGGDPGDSLTGSRALRLTGRMLTIVEAEG